MLTVKFNVDSIKKLNDYIKRIGVVKQLENNIGMQKEIKKKCLETVKEVATERLSGSKTSNEDMKQDYLESIILEDDENGKGFKISSNLTVEDSGYPFSISLAFEYGTGLVGLSQNIPNAWQYNVNDNHVTIHSDGKSQQVSGWWIPKEKAGNSNIIAESSSGNAVVTQGYEGMEIFRFAAEEIQAQLPKWIKDYLREEKW